MRQAIFVLFACGSSSTQEVHEPVRAPDPPVVASEVGAVDIEANQLDPFRIAGETKIVPNDLDRVHLPLGAQLVGQFQICLDATGKPVTVAVVNTSGIANYDTKIVGRMRAWSFKPILVEGQPAKVCSVITVVFRQDKLIEQH